MASALGPRGAHAFLTGLYEEVAEWAPTADSTRLRDNGGIVEHSLVAAPVAELTEWLAAPCG